MAAKIKIKHQFHDIDKSKTEKEIKPHIDELVKYINGYDSNNIKIVSDIEELDDGIHVTMSVTEPKRK